MSSVLRNVVIVGASGNIGRLILDGLVTSTFPKFHITVLTRSSSTALFPPNVKIRKTDYSDSDLVAAFRAQDAVISVMGMEGFSLQTRLIDAALQAGVKRFIPSEFSFNSLSPGVTELLPFVEDAKVKVLEYLKEKATKESGLTWSAIWTGLLLDWTLENGILEYDLAAQTATIWDAGDKVFTATNIAQLQRAVIAVLEHPDKTSNKLLYIASVETSQNEILAALEKATAAKWKVNKTTTEKEIRAGREALSKGDFGGVMKLVRGTSFADLPNLRANFVRDEELANELLGLEMESVQVTVKRLVDTQKQRS